MGVAAGVVVVVVVVVVVFLTHVSQHYERKSRTCNVIVVHPQSAMYGWGWVRWDKAKCERGASDILH